MFTSRQIHDGITTPTGTPHHLFNFFFNRGSGSRVTDIGVDFHQKVTTDNHRLSFRVIDIGWNNRTTFGDFFTNKFRGDVIGFIGWQFAFGLQCSTAHAFANGDIFHFRGDDALTCIVHLAHVFAQFGFAWQTTIGEQRNIKFLPILIAGKVGTERR